MTVMKKRRGGQQSWPPRRFFVPLAFCRERFILVVTRRTDTSARSYSRLARITSTITFIPMLPINISVMNVELTDARKHHIEQTIAPLLSLVDSPSEVVADVIIRSIRRPLSGEQFCVMVRIKAKYDTFYAVGMEHDFNRALAAAEGEMRKNVCRTHVPDTKIIEHLRQHAHERYFFELFVT